MTNFYSTEVTLKVFSKRPLDNLTLGEIETQIERSDFLSGSLSSDSTQLTPMQMSEDLRSNEIERESLMGDEAKEDQPHISIEYDESYSGGDYAQVGDRVYIPQGVFDRFGQDEKKAFEWWTGLDPVCIIYCAPRYLYTFYGEPWEEEEN